MTSATQGSTGLAERYAGALFELAEADKALDQVNGELQALAGLIRGSNDLERMIRSPVISRDEQRKAINAILERQGASSLTRRFVGLVAHNRRLFTLPSIIAAFSQRLARARGESTADVVSAQPLTPDQLSAIGTALKKVVGTQMVLSTRTDPSLLGGIVVKVGSRMIDSSLKTKLLRLSFAIKGIG
ncbi:MAG: F0F1 ATP synthase subunit delta [Rhodospirillales bacterium]|nr:F0F1 ATP synthase subunit delta [Rhodospirillales bacterium]